MALACWVLSRVFIRHTFVGTASPDQRVISDGPRRQRQDRHGKAPCPYSRSHPGSGLGCSRHKLNVMTRPCLLRGPLFPSPPCRRTPRHVCGSRHTRREQLYRALSCSSTSASDGPRLGAASSSGLHLLTGCGRHHGIPAHEECHAPAARRLLLALRGRCRRRGTSGVDSLWRRCAVSASTVTDMTCHHLQTPCVIA